MFEFTLLENALAGARDRLSADATGTARSRTAFGKNEGPMAELAQRAIFTEALLAAVHARLAELKATTK